MRSIRALCAALAALAAISFATLAAAQSWPSRSILVVSPFAAGAANDIVARVLLDQVGQQIGQAFVLENRPGGGGIVGVASVVRADPDGYTLLLSSASMSSAGLLHKSLPYDAQRDLEPIAMFGAQPSVLVAAPGKGFKSVADLVAAAKAKPGVLNFASAGIGSASHIAGERFRLAAGINVQHVPYRRPVEALADVMTGRIDFYFLPLAPALPLINQGKVTALAVSTTKRAPGAAKCADDRRGRLSRRYIFVLGRHLSAGEDAPPHRRQAQHRGERGPLSSGAPREIGAPRRAADADDARAIRQVLC